MAELTGDVDAAVADAFRAEWGRVVATLIGSTGDWDLAEECAQDAFTLALERWARDGVPRRPGAWLTTAARNRAIDRQRRGAVLTTKLEEMARTEPAVGEDPDDDHDDGAVEDDRLRLIFSCAHPALPLEARVALTLRTLAGLSTAEIARAFVVAEPTMAKRLVRAKAKIRNAGIPYRVPPAHLLPERTGGVLGVLYLLFNEGYAATADASLVRQELTGEAIRLARLLARLMPQESEALGLLALMLLHDARRPARTDGRGDLVPLEQQDRTRWNADLIAEGVEILGAAGHHGPPGPYQLQPAIAAQHATAAQAAATDWPAIVALYDQLARLVPSPVVALNRAVAVAMADGPAAGLELVDALEASGRLAGYHLLPATRADLLRRLRRHAEAATAYRQALALVGSDAEHRYLTRRLDDLPTTRPARPEPRDQEMADTATTTTRISKVGTVFVPVTDQDRALEFYRDKLGFEKRADFTYGQGSRWIEVAPPGASNSISLVGASEGVSAGGDGAHCAFATADIEADYATLSARGVDVDPEIARTGKRRPGIVSVDVTIGDPVPAQFFFRDPDGNRFLIVEPG